MIRIKSYLAEETYNSCVAFITTFIIIAILYIALKMAPFGTNALSDVDARIQYIDYFSYLKQILLGDGNTVYSFNKGLGSNIWAVIAYYLLSPFNLLVVFFNQENLNVFYDLLVIINFVFLRVELASLRTLLYIIRMNSCQYRQRDNIFCCQYFFRIIPR